MIASRVLTQDTVWSQTRDDDANCDDDHFDNDDFDDFDAGDDDDNSYDDIYDKYENNHDGHLNGCVKKPSCDL